MDRPTPRLASLIAAAGLGALAMYVCDPQRGARRFGLARRLVHDPGDAAREGWRDLRSRVSGIAGDIRHRWRRNKPSDRTLEMCVRTELGRWVTHPHAVRVNARDGRVVLGGCVLAAERAQLQRAVEGVSGVRSVELRLAVVDTPEGIPSAPSGGVRSGSRPPAPIGERHASAARWLGMTASAALVACGIARRGPAGLLLSAIGVAIAADVGRAAHRARHRSDASQAASEPTRETMRPRPIEATVPRDVVGRVETQR